jgi:tRNA-modifying protein YgfZ
VPAALAGALANKFDLLVFSEEVRIADVSAALAQLSVAGSRASDVIASALEAPELTPRIDALPPLGHMELGNVRIARADDFDLPVFDVFVNAEFHQTLVQRMRALGATEMPMDVFDALRIEAGRPAFGVDMTEETIPLEAGLLDRAISTTKGCYVGQEIIIRVLHRGGGRVSRRLMQLRVTSETAGPPSAGATLLRNGQPVGRITSSAQSPDGAGIVALGYVTREHAEIGRQLSLSSEDGGGGVEIIGFAG